MHSSIISKFKPSTIIIPSIFCIQKCVLFPTEPQMHTNSSLSLSLFSIDPKLIYFGSTLKREFVSDGASSPNVFSQKRSRILDLQNLYILLQRRTLVLLLLWLLVSKYWKKMRCYLAINAWTHYLSIFPCNISDVSTVTTIICWNKWFLIGWSCSIWVILEAPIIIKLEQFIIINNTSALSTKLSPVNVQLSVQEKMCCYQKMYYQFDRWFQIAWEKARCLAINTWTHYLSIFPCNICDIS